MASRTPTIEQHPDIVAMRERYDQTAESPPARIVEGLGFLAGLWLAMSPWVVGFADETGITVSNLFTGLAVVALALGFASAFGRTHNLAWVTPLLGLWTILSPWLVADTDRDRAGDRQQPARRHRDPGARSAGAGRGVARSRR